MTLTGVGGFNRTEAENFVSNFFTDANKIKQVLQFRPSDSREKFPIQQCPILLSFFCFLVAEQEIDLSDKTTSMGDIYTRLVKCLYKKFTIRKGMKFEQDDFVQVMKSVGQLALQTLMSNNQLLQREEVLGVVGDFAFDYGLFAGHEDIRLLGDPTADLYVTYAHRSLEEFFGSFGFIQALDDGKSVDDILGSDCKTPVFMGNPLVLNICLWFLSTSGFVKKDECYDILTSYTAKRLDSKVLDPDEIGHRYTAIDMLLPPQRLGRSTYQFFCDILNKCKNMTAVQLIPSADVVDHYLGLMKRDFIDRLTKIIIGDDSFELKDTDNKFLTLSIESHYDDALQIMNLLLEKYNLAQRNPHLYLKTNKITVDECNITPLLCTYIKQLYIDVIRSISLVTASTEFPQCPVLTELTIQGRYIDESVPRALGRAIRSGKLPFLTRVTLINSRGQSRYHWPDEVDVTLIDR